MTKAIWHCHYHHAALLCRDMNAHTLLRDMRTDSHDPAVQIQSMGFHVSLHEQVAVLYCVCGCQAHVVFAGSTGVWGPCTGTKTLSYHASTVQDNERS